MEQTDLTLIIPAKYESESLPIILDDLKKFNFQIIVSLHHEDKLTIKAINSYNLRTVMQKNKGYGNALIEGINACKTKYFCIFNADGSFNENDLPKMLDLNKKNDFIFTTRYGHGASSDDDTIVTFIGNKFFSLLGKIFFSLNITDILYTYVMGKTESFKKLNIMNNDFRFCVEFPIKMHRKNMKYDSISSHEKKRIAGKKKVSPFKDGFLILIEMIRLFFKK
ncbi:glycosyltransferase [Candidatus Pelagibacter sp.]|nr:glycosyltransferase [Candidatus Pelagibacter sp.]